MARGVDRAEAAVVLVLTAIWLVALPIAASVASVSWADATARASERQQSLTAVEAVVERGVPGPIGAADAAPVWSTAPVSWTGPGGHRGTGFVEVPATAAVGDHVMVWLNGAGRLVPAPPSPEALAGTAILTGAGGWLLIGLSLLVLGRLIRRRLDRRRLSAWGQEWAQVEPGRHPF